jgi:transposase InsO family protein
LVSKWCLRRHSNSKVEKKLSDAALSRADATRPMDWVIPKRSHTWTKSPAVNSEPLSALNRIRFSADRGTQYLFNDYLEFCHLHQLRPSVGRTGICWDNAVAESFWQSLTRECLQGRIFTTRAEPRRAIFPWINWYNTTRLHTSLDGVPPIEWEHQYRQAS